ncbi:RICIN domain-containing protein [Streptomyces scopuliridis]|uniref:RICIN domain-containing protein n=1 Tax=Streptomyces scopuliridis TaxID=452529 RepID=UPI0036C71A56
MRVSRTSRRTTLLLALSLAVFAAFTAFVPPPAGAAESRPYAGPVMSRTGADPWIQYYDGDYYLVTTSWTSELTMRKSPTPAGLSTAPSVRVWTDSTSSRCCNMGAPRIRFRDGHWYLYYVAGQGIEDYHPTQRAHVLESAGADPMGPYGYRDQLDDGRLPDSTPLPDATPPTPNGGLSLLGATRAGASGERAATPTAYTLVNRSSGKCLEVEGGSRADGANVLQWACHGGARQRWRVEDLGDDTSRLVNAASGKVLDTAACSVADGADLRQWSWLGTICQAFRLVVTDQGGWVRLVGARSGKVADVAGCSTADGADVRQWPWLGSTCQQWRLNPV